jgi:hypothetical protein
MEPSRYCQDALGELRDGAADIGIQQKVVVLAYYAEVGASEARFATDLRLLAEGAERDGRMALAAAARAVLDDWKAARAAPTAAGVS